MNNNMSADTSIGIGKFPDGYRITGLVQAIDNIYWSKENESKEEYMKTVNNFFGNSEIYNNFVDAFKKANDLRIQARHEGMCLEYGIIYLGEFDFYIEGSS